MTPRLRIVAGTGLIGLAAGLLSCGPNSDSGPRLLIRFAPTPPTVGQARVIVQLPDDAPLITDAEVAGRPIDDAEALVVTAEPSGPNVFAVAAFPFAKAGDWRMTVVATTATGEVLRDSTTVRVVGGFSPP